MEGSSFLTLPRYACSTRCPVADIAAMPGLLRRCPLIQLLRPLLRPR